MQSEKSKPIQSMITLKNDRLCFSFPEIDEALRRLVEQHVNSTLPAIIAADRSCAVRALQSSWRFREATPEKRRKAENQLIHATPERIETALRRKCYERSLNSTRRKSFHHSLEIGFQRTLRIPDDGKIYPLPAGFGRFPLRHVDDYKDTVPAPWMERGGVLMPMYQSEALWINFSTRLPVRSESCRRQNQRPDRRVVADRFAGGPTKLPGSARAALAGWVRGAKGRDPPVCRDAARRGIFGRGTDNRKGGHGRHPTSGFPVTCRGIFSLTKSRNTCRNHSKICSMNLWTRNCSTPAFNSR